MQTFFWNVSIIDHRLREPEEHADSIPVPYRHLPVTESVCAPAQRRGSIMPEAYSHSYPSLLPIQRPRCPKCQGRMMLSRIEPGPAHSDFLTFECPKCEHVQKMVVGDPMKAINTGWTAGGLRSPE